MKNKIEKYLKSSFIKNVLVLVTGTALGQVINMILMPLITRMYGPVSYGLMGTFQTIITIISPIAALAYPIAIVLPDKDEIAQLIVKLSLIISTIISVISIIIVFFLKDEISAILNLKVNSNYLYFIPLVIIFATGLQVMDQWLIRKNQFGIFARINIITVLLINGGKLLVGSINPTAGVLIVFSSLTQGVNAFLFFVFSDKSIIKKSNVTENKVTLFEVAKKYRDFPIYRAPETFFNEAAGGLPLLLLTVFFGPQTAGYYSLARSVLGAPISLIGNAVGKVFFPKVTQSANEKKKIAPLVSNATLQLALISLIPFSIIILFGPQLFSFIFGSEWKVAGVYARWLALWSYTTFINRPSVQTLPILLRQKFLLQFTVTSLIIKLIGLIIGFYIFKSDLIAIILFTVIGASSNLYLIFSTIRDCRLFDKDIYPE